MFIRNSLLCDFPDWRVTLTGREHYRIQGARPILEEPTMSLQKPLTARTIRFGAVFAVFSICLLLLSGLSQAGDKHPRPFKATVHGGITGTSEDGSIVYVQVKGEGTHLGKFVEELTHYVNWLDLSFTGTAKFTAANGDTFYTDFSGQLTPISSEWATFTVTHTVVGGTGRFEGASGSFDGNHGLVNLVTGEDMGDYEGTIAY
jgi:hypothetical protein